MPKVNYKRQDVVAAAPDWKVVSDCVAGQRVMRLAATDGNYLRDLKGGQDDLESVKRQKEYIEGAVFYNATGRTLEGLVGQVFAKKTALELTPTLERYEGDIDGAGTGLNQQAKQTLKEILKKGHGGLLSDFPTGADGDPAITVADIEEMRYRPRILFVEAEKIINWRVTTVGGESLLSLVMIEESKVIDDDGFEMTIEPRWREIRLVIFDDDGEKLPTPYVYVQVWKENDGSQNEAEQFVVDEGPHYLTDYRDIPLSKIPFQFLGATNNEPHVDKAPLLDIATLNVAHWQNSADEEESSFLCGQPTPLFSGLTQPWVDTNFKGQVILGSRAAVPLPENGKGELLQADPNTMAREGMKHKEEQMKSLGAKLIEPGSAFKGTATEAIIDESSESSILSSATKNVSEGYKNALEFAAQFVGEIDSDKLVFELNSDFAANHITAPERAQAVAEYMAGVTTFAELRAQLRKGGVDLDEDDEKAKQQIADEFTPAPGE